MTKLIELAAEVQKFCTEQGWRFCFIGGLALQRWGRPRLTLDVDITLLTGLGNEEGFVTALLGRYHARMPNAAEFAMQNRVLLLENANGIGIDVALAWMPYEEKVVERATVHRFGKQVALLTCSAEDLIVSKAFASRPQDWVDIEDVIRIQRDKLDRDYIFENLEPLCEIKEAPEIMTQLRKLFQANPSQ